MVVLLPAYWGSIGRDGAVLTRRSESSNPGVQFEAPTGQIVLSATAISDILAPRMDGLEETRLAVEAGGPSCLVIDDLTAGDLDKIAWSGTAAHVRAVADALAQVGRGKMEYLVVRALDGTPVAKAAINYAEAPGVGTIMQMATHDGLQGLGLGSTLIAAAEERIRRRGVMVARLGVEDDNPRARALYERLGYVAVQRRAVSWEAEAPDGSLFQYQTVITELDKALT